MDTIDAKAIHARIQLIKESTEQLRQLGHEFPAVQKNASRMLACIKMLELNVSDVFMLLEEPEDKKE